MSMSASEFVTAWMNAYKQGWSLVRLAESLDLDPTGVSKRANRYRARGVKLPVLTDGRQQRTDMGDVDALNTLVDELA